MKRGIDIIRAIFPSDGRCGLKEIIDGYIYRWEVSEKKKISDHYKQICEEREMFEKIRDYLAREKNETANHSG